MLLIYLVFHFCNFSSGIFQVKPQTYISKEKNIDELKQEVIETEDQLVEDGINEGLDEDDHGSVMESSDQFILKSYNGPRLCLVIKRQSQSDEYFSYFKRLRKYSHYLQFKT